MSSSSSSSSSSSKVPKVHTNGGRILPVASTTSTKNNSMKRQKNLESSSSSSSTTTPRIHIAIPKGSTGGNNDKKKKQRQLGLVGTTTTLPLQQPQQLPPKKKKMSKKKKQPQPQPQVSASSSSSRSTKPSIILTKGTSAIPAEAALPSHPPSSSVDIPQEWPSQSAFSLPSLPTHTIQSIQKCQSEYPINEECTSLKIVPSGRHIVAGFTDGTLRLFDLTGTFKPSTNGKSSSSSSSSDTDDSDSDEEEDASHPKKNNKSLHTPPKETTIQDDFFDTNSSDEELMDDSEDDDDNDDGQGCSPRKRYAPRVGRPSHSCVGNSSSTPFPGNNNHNSPSLPHNGGLVMSKQFQQYGSVVSQIFARGVHTSLLMEVDVSEDGLYAFGGVARGSMELVALDMSRVEHHHDVLQQQQQQQQPQQPKDMLDLIRVHRHSDAKLKGFGACTRLRSSTHQKYLLLTGRGIKNIHIWSFTPPQWGVGAGNRPPKTKAAAQWQCLYDTQTNGNSINLLHFRYDPHGLLQGISKSDDQKLRVWDLRLEQHEGSKSNPLYDTEPIIQCFDTPTTKAGAKRKGRKPKNAAATPPTTISAPKTATTTQTLERPKRPPFCDVSSTESCLGVCGSFAFCGGGGMYNQMSVVSLDVENVKSPYNHMDLALPKTGALGGSSVGSDSSLAGLAAGASTSTSSTRGGRRQQRGELKSIVNVAGMVMDAGHVLLELSDGSVVQYCQHQLDAVGLPQLRPVSPTMFQSKLELSSSVNAAPPMMMIQKEDISGRQICLGRVGAGGNVIAAMTTYNPSTGRGNIVLRCLDGQHEKQPDGFWGFHGVSSLPLFASSPSPLQSSLLPLPSQKPKTVPPVVSKAMVNRSKDTVALSAATSRRPASDSPPADKKAIAAIACPTPLMPTNQKKKNQGHLLGSSPESAAAASSIQLFSSSTQPVVTPKPKSIAKKSSMAAPSKAARDGKTTTKKTIIGSTPPSSSSFKRTSPIPNMATTATMNTTTPVARATTASRVVAESPEGSVSIGRTSKSHSAATTSSIMNKENTPPPRASMDAVSIESSSPNMLKHKKTPAGTTTSKGVTVSPDQKSPLVGREQFTPSPPNKDSGAIERFLKPTATIVAAKSKQVNKVVGTKSIQKARVSTAAGKVAKSVSTKKVAVSDHGAQITTTKAPKATKGVAAKAPKMKRASSKDSTESASSKRKKAPKVNTGTVISRKRSASPTSSASDRTNLNEIATALCEISRTPPKKQRVAPKPRQPQASKNSIPSARKQAPSSIYHAFDQPKSLLDRVTNDTVEDRLEGLCGLNRNDDKNFLSTAAPHAAARRRLAAQHRAAHEMIRKKVMSSVDSIIRSLRTEIATADEAKTWLEESLVDYREMLDDMLHRQQMEASTLAANNALYQPGKQATLLHVSFPFPEVFSQARTSLQAFVSPKSNSAK